MTDLLCSKGCGRPRSRRGLCAAHYEQRRTRDAAYGRWETLYTDAFPVRAHVEALRAAGMGTRTIAEVAGVSRNNIQQLLLGRPERGQGPSRKMLARIAAKIMTVPVPQVPHAGVAGGAKVPAIGTVRRMQALVRFGYTRSDLADRLGITPSNATHLFRKNTAHVTAETALKVEALFAELQLVQGPSARAAAEGRRRRWPLPFDWDEETIDNPDATPQRHLPSEGRRDSEAVAVRRERVAALTAAGWSARRIAQHLRITDRTVQRDRIEVAS